MSWKFWKKDKNPVEFNFSNTMGNEPPIVAMSTLFRWYCYDLGIRDHNKLASKVGLSGVSDDVEAMEIDDSNERLANIEPIMPFLNSIAQLNALAISHFQGETFKEHMHLEDSDMDEATMLVQEVLGQVSMSALIAGFSAALSLGVVKSSNVQTREITREQL